MTQKKILVIGSEGFVGKPFCTYLDSLGNNVIHFDIKKSTNEDARTASLNLSSVDQVYFLAWDVGGAKYLYDKNTQVGQMDWNIRLMTNVFDQLDKARKKFLFVSSQLAGDIDTVYGVGKRLGEVWTRELGGQMVRFWNVYGPIEANSIKSHVISDLVLQAVKNKYIKLMTNGQEKRQFIHIDDICNGLVTAMDAEAGKPYDLTTYRWQTIYEIAEIIQKHTGADIITGDAVGRTPETPYGFQLPNWETTIATEDGLLKMVESAKADEG